MRKISLLLSVVICLTLLGGCRKAVMKEYFEDNTLETVYKKHSSFTITTTLADGSTYSRYYEPNITYIDKDEKATIYLSNGSYSYFHKTDDPDDKDDYYCVEIFNLQDYSYFIMGEQFTAPLVAENSKASSVLSEEEKDGFTIVNTRPSSAYHEVLHDEYGIDSGEFEITYKFDGDMLLNEQELYLNGKLFATLTVEYDTKRPKIADANTCRTVKISMGAGSSDVRSVIAKTVKGDSFKLEDGTFDLYEGPYGDAKCTIPYQSNGADNDAFMYWKKK